jgi:large subunit ribosomal protein L23
MEFSRIILRPYQTEKTYKQQQGKYGKYAFIVDPAANKYEISIAFQTIYGHKPISIATQIRKPVVTKAGTAKPGFSRLTKIAYITLSEGISLSPEAQTVEKETTAALNEAGAATSTEVTKKTSTEVTKKTVAKKVTNKVSTEKSAKKEVRKETK